MKSARLTILLAFALGHASTGAKASKQDADSDAYIHPNNVLRMTTQEQAALTPSLATPQTGKKVGYKTCYLMRTPKWETIFSTRIRDFGSGESTFVYTTLAVDKQLLRKTLAAAKVKLRPQAIKAKGQATFFESERNLCIEAV